MAKEKTKKGQSYSSDDIDTLRFPESIRKSPGMYIGGVDAYGRWVTVKELLDNALDEALAGRNDYIGLHVDKKGYVWVLDEGTGIPQGTKSHVINNGKKKIKVETPTMQAVFSELHTSGKFRDSAYKTSIGTHGVGSKATNATAESFEVWTCYKDKWYHIGFEKGILTSPVAKCKAPKLWNGKAIDHGTLIRFKHDSTLFKVKSHPAEMLGTAGTWAEMMAYLNAGLTIEISDHSDKKPKKYHSKNGPKDYITKRLAELGTKDEPLAAEPKLFEFSNGLADVVISFSSYDSCDLRGYVNGSYTRDGGKHVDAVTGALYQALLASDVKAEKKKEKLSERVKKAKTARAKAKAKGKAKERAFTERDVQEGLLGLVNAKLHKPLFNSQDKVKLSDDRMGKEFETELSAAFLTFFEDNKALAARLREKAQRMNELKSKFVASKQAASDINKLKKSGVSGKYAPPNKKFKPEDCELFIIEGDSAAFGLRELREQNQGLVPLKGKVMNAMRSTPDQVLSSDEPLMVLAAMGYNPGAKDPLAKLNFGRIVLLADPDPDGPFVGDTLIRIKPPATDGWDGVESRDVPIKELAEAGIGFQVPVFTGGAAQWCNATARAVDAVDTLIAVEVDGHKYKVSPGHKFVVVRTPATRYRICDETLLTQKGYPSMGDTLAFIDAKDLKIGDRIWCPSNDKVKGQSDKTTGRGFLAVNKMRVQKQAEPVTVYCLDVPKHHHFILPSGVVSGNCHINTLLLGLLYKFTPELFDRGMVYLADAPLFYSKHGSQILYGDTLSEVRAKLKAAKAPANSKINRIKGWGEINSAMIHMLALNPATRRLIQVKPLEKVDHTEFVHILGDDVQMRKKMLGIESDSADDEEDAPKAKKAKKGAK